MLGKISVLGSIAALALGSTLILTQPAAAADGCGPAKYRGPGGACHRFGSGPYPGGYYGPYRNAYRWNGCPATGEAHGDTAGIPPITVVCPTAPGNHDASLVPCGLAI
jgi:hypothetical protein